MMNTTSQDTMETPAGSNTSQSEGQHTNQGSRKHHKHNDKGTQKGKYGNNNKSNFQGNTEGMNSHLFQCHNETQDRQQFEKTVEALCEYINKELKHAGDVSSLCDTFNVIDLRSVQPEDLDENEKSMFVKKKWEKEVERYLERVNELDSNLRHIFAVIYGQCSYSMQTKLISSTHFEAMKKKSDCGWLLKEIKGVMNQFESSRLIHVSLDIALQNYYTYYQGGSQSLHNFYKTFVSQVDVLEHYGADIGVDRAFLEAARLTTKGPDLSSTDYDSMLIAHEENLAKIARKKAIAVSFLRRVSRHKYGQLWNDLQNSYARGNDDFPNTIVEAYDMLLHYVPPQQHGQRSSKPSRGNSGVQFVQNGQNTPAPIPGLDGILHPDVECYGCHGFGHFKPQCPLKKNNPIQRNGLQLLQIVANESANPNHSDMTFVQKAKSDVFIPCSWLLLDSQSTVSVFNNSELLTNIRKSPSCLTVHTNGGRQVSEFIGDHYLFGTVWYNPSSLANILSMALVRKSHRITMDSSVEAALSVHCSDGQLLKFREFDSGLYFYDTHISSTKANSPLFYSSSRLHNPVSFLSSVKSNKEKFTRREIEGADAARLLYRKLGRPSEAQFQHALKYNQFINCPVTPDDAKRALTIYGPDITTLKGKTTKSKGAHTPSFQRVDIPASIIEHHENITLGIDFMYINSNPFLHTISRKLQFRTIASVTSRSKNTMLREVKAVVNLYHKRGFNVIDINADKEFECIRTEMLPIRLHIVDKDSHVPEVERSIRVVKERVRSAIAGLPFKRIPRIMIRGLAEFAVKSLNQLPALNGVSTLISPLTIMTGDGAVDVSKLTLEFGEYVQVFEDNLPSNNTNSRTTGGIAMNPTNSSQGGYNFMSLNTGECLSRKQWTSVPMPEWVVPYVEDIAEVEKQKALVDGEPLWEWRPGVTLNADDPSDDDDEQDIDVFAERHLQEINEDVEMQLDVNESDDDSISYDGELYDIDEADDDPPPAPEGALISDIDETSIDDNISSTTPDSDDSDISFDPDSSVDNTNATFDSEAAIAPDSTSDTDDITMAPNQRSVRQNDTVNIDSEPQKDNNNLRRSTRNRNTTNFRVRFADEMSAAGNAKSYRPQHQLLQQGIAEFKKDNNDTATIQKFITGFIMTQMTAKAGIKKHGQVAIDALMKEFQQLNDKSVFKGLDASKLSQKDKRQALKAINLIKEKRCGKIKGRTVANGRPQRELFTKEETTSPTVSIEALMLSIMIDAKERRDVAVADVEGAYLHADMDIFTVLKLEGLDVDIMCDMDASYKKFVTEENGKKVLYLELVKALYGCVRSALLWYDLFTSTLMHMGFKLNPYDPCVANLMIDGKQCTIVWYVDDNKISHVNSKVVSMIIDKIEKRFGKMTVTRGKTHEFLGMDITYETDGTAKINMSRYTKESIDEFMGEIKKSSPTPATKDLFDIKENSPKLNKSKSENFHSIVAKLLYVSKRARADIQLPVAFLCTRVTKSTEQDWKKLQRVLEYLYGTIDDVLIIGADDITTIQTWVDASYAVHEDMKSHTGGTISFGRGALLSKSTKQKLNTKSSTEAELVGASDYLPNTIWTKYFLEAQGYEIKRNIYNQDNQSAIRLEKNGKKSEGQKSRHIDIRYFWVKDRLDSNDVSIVYCPTESMLADFFTKPLQGNLFRRLRDVIMGREHISKLQFYASNATSKERVESRKCEDEAIGDSNMTSETRVQNSDKSDIKKMTYADAVRENNGKMTNIIVDQRG
jgi:hypothetical protein